MEWFFLNGFLLSLPVLFIRYGILAMISRDALQRAAYEPSFEPKYMEGIYSLCSILLLIVMFFHKIKYSSTLNQIGFGLFILGSIIYLISTINFAYPNGKLNTNGLYKLSRNPMYVGFFLYFIGVVLIVESIVLFIVLIVFQIATHYMILSEEKWCIENFGEVYSNYMKKVRRYI